MLEGLGRTAQGIVPDLVGLSLGLVRDELTFPLVASSSAISRMPLLRARGPRPGALVEAGLSFASRRRAALAPVRVQDRDDVDTTTGVLAARHEEPTVRAAAARVVLALHQP